MGPARPRVDPRLAAWLATLIALMAAGGGAWLYQQWNGLRVTNMRNTFMWGNYILFFMFFVGLSAGGLIVASSGRLFGATRFKPIVRVAVLEATVAITLAGTFIVPDLGRPERLLHIFLFANLTSPMVWDVTIVLLYLGLSATYVWLYTRADLAGRGSPLALGTGTSERALRRDDRLKGALAWVALPAAILLHSITAWIFGLQIGRTFWYTAVMAPMFIASALVSGLALVILLALAVRWAGRLRFDDGLVPYLGGLLAVFIASEAFLLFAELLTAAYPGAPAEGQAVTRLLAGPYLVPFLGETAFGLLLPFALLASARLRRYPAVVALAAGIAVVGIFVHRLNLLLNALSVPTIALPPGLSIGVGQAGSVGLPGAAFATSYWYLPSPVEWLVVGGVLALGAFLFTVAAWYLPLQEPDHH
ncbi:MAG TPA: NrfD/PsrC family molybdoenzyme membrane anchor subunit [Candidatus Limnocylindrales bacterium]